MVLALDAGQVLEPLTNFLGLCPPADAGNPGDVLIAVLAKHTFDTSNIGRPIEHEGVHGARDFTILGLHLLLALLVRAGHPCLHVAHGRIHHVLGHDA